MAGASYRRAVTALTLFGGFASTVFWPLSQYLLDTVGWRATFAIYAGLHRARVPAAASAWSVPRRHAGAPGRAKRRMRRRVRDGDGAVFAWLAAALSLAAFIGSAIAAHLITCSPRPDFRARDAVLVGSLIGPMQVAGRIMEFAFNRHVRALAVGTFAFALMAARWRCSRRCTASGSSRWRSRSPTAGPTA